MPDLNISLAKSDADPIKVGSLHNEKLIANTLSRKHPSIALNKNQSAMDVRGDFDISNNKAYEIMTES